MGAELAIAKLLVGKVVGASKCGCGLLVDCETNDDGSSGSRLHSILLAFGTLTVDEWADGTLAVDGWAVTFGSRRTDRQVDVIVTDTDC